MCQYLPSECNNRKQMGIRNKQRENRRCLSMYYMFKVFSRMSLFDYVFKKLIVEEIVMSLRYAGYFFSRTYSG